MSDLAQLCEAGFRSLWARARPANRAAELIEWWPAYSGPGNTMVRPCSAPPVDHLAEVTGRALRLEDRGVKHSNLTTGDPDELKAHKPVAPAHARGHGGTHKRCRGPRRRFVWSTLASTLRG